VIELVTQDTRNGVPKHLTFKISKFKMGMVLTDRLSFIRDNKALNKGGGLKKKGGESIFLKAISVSKEVLN
jgi:hypothetical protein